jgi:hypothetical protein
VRICGLRACALQYAANKSYSDKLEEEVRATKERLTTALENEKRLHLKYQHLEQSTAAAMSQAKKAQEQTEASVVEARAQYTCNLAENQRLSDQVLRLERLVEDGERTRHELEQELLASRDACLLHEQQANGTHTHTHTHTHTCLPAT